MRGSLWHILIGYVTISLKGLSLERFLNALHKKGVVLHDVKRLSRQEVRLRVSRPHHKIIRKTLADGGYDCRILRRRGLTYFGERMLLRPVLLLGLALCLGALFWAGDFVMKVSYEGIMGDTVRTSVQQATEDAGIVPGAYKGNWDHKRMERQILKAVPELCFVSIIEQGMDVTIEAIEGKPVPLSQKRNEPGNVVAAKDCMIKRMSVLNGAPVVEVGQTVRRGALLISGVIEVKHGDPYLTGAMGEIKGRVWYNARVKRPLYHMLRTPTGQMHRVYAYAFGDNILYEGGECPYDEYELESREVTLLEGVWPFCVIIREYSEVKSKVIPLDEADVTTLAKAEALDAALAKVADKSQIVDSDVSIRMKDGQVVADAYVETLEEIAVPVPLT